MKTNVDFNSPQEGGIFRTKERKKENENNSRINNTNCIIEETMKKINLEEIDFKLLNGEKIEINAGGMVEEE